MKKAKNCENGGQNGIRDDKEGPREDQDRTVGLPAGQPAGFAGREASHAGEPAGSVVVGPFLCFFEAILAFFWEKESKNVRKRV